MRLLPRYLLCLIAVLLLFSAYCHPLVAIENALPITKLRSIAEPGSSQSGNPKFSNKHDSQPLSDHFGAYDMYSALNSFASEVGPLQPMLYNNETLPFLLNHAKDTGIYDMPEYLVAAVKSRSLRYPFMKVYALETELKPFSVKRLMYKDTVLKGAVWRGAAIGAVLGTVLGFLAIYGLEQDEWLSPGSAERPWIIGWFAFNGTGLGGFFGFVGQRRKQRRLNERLRSLPSARQSY